MSFEPTFSPSKTLDEELRGRIEVLRKNANKQRSWAESLRSEIAEHERAAKDSDALADEYQSLLDEPRRPKTTTVVMTNILNPVA